MSPNEAWLPELGVVRVATPCAAKWEQMTGDAQVRHCAACDLNVYHLSALTADDARALILRTEGRLCVRFFTRPDGRLLTRDCPKGVAARLRRRIAAVVAAVGAFAGAQLAYSPAPVQPDAAPQLPCPSAAAPAGKDGPVVAADWADRRRKDFGLDREVQLSQGKLATTIGVIRNAVVEVKR